MYKSGTGDEYKTGANANLHDPISALLSSPPPPLLDFFIHWKTFMGAIPTNTRVKDVKFYKAPLRPKIFL